MKKIFDKIITGFFIITLGILWYCSTKYYVKPDKYQIAIYDILGKQVKAKDVRTEFNTLRVTQSYISEYEKRFPQYSFSICTESPNIKNNSIPRILKNIQR